MLVNKTRYVPKHRLVRMGDIGANPHEVEFEPLEAPAVPEPVVEPQPEVEPELVPA